MPGRSVVTEWATNIAIIADPYRVLVGNGNCVARWFKKRQYMDDGWIHSTEVLVFKVSITEVPEMFRYAIQKCLDEGAFSKGFEAADLSPITKGGKPPRYP